VHVSVSGLPESQAEAARAAIRRTLQPWANGDDLCIVAHRLHSGDWSLMVFDGVNMETLKDGLAERVLRALRDLRHEAPGVPGGAPGPSRGGHP
jgi:hypothetical protein